MRTQSICLALAIVLMCPYASAQWVQTGPMVCERVWCFAVSGTNVFAGTWGGAGVYLSTNNGASWSVVNAGLTDSSVFALTFSNSNLFAGTWQGGVFRSTDSGANWVRAGLTNNGIICSFAVSGTSLFAAGSGGIFLSTNNGNSWTPASNGLPPGALIFNALAVSGTNLFAGARFIVGAWDWGVFVSTDNGGNWTRSSNGMADSSVWALAVSGTSLFAGTLGGGVFRSTNNGADWTQCNNGLTNTSVFSLTISGTNLFAGTGGGVFLSTDNATSWTDVSAGLIDSSVYALAVSGTNLFVGTGSGVWRRPLSEMITSVGTPLTELPTRFSLEQNYPNPFNPTTVISYQLSAVSEVRLVVLDLLGREVAVLVNRRKAPGSYDVTFNGSNLATGAYFYRLQAGDFVATKKLLIVK